MRIAVVLLTVAAAGSAAAQPSYTLYDQTAGSLPAAQMWLTYATLGGSASQSYVSGQGARLTTDTTAYAGYSNYFPTTVPVNPAFPTLDRTAGFRLTWTLQVHQESHVSDNRAGFSTILLSSDRRGVELGFWGNEVWAQNVGFTHGEGAAWNTGPATEYALTIQGDTYRLDANGSLLLTGSVRDYSSAGIPYSLSNYLFFGDDTSSAAADITLGRVTLVSPVPEPASLLAVMAAFVSVGVGLRRQFGRADR